MLGIRLFRSLMLFLFTPVCALAQASPSPPQHQHESMAGMQMEESFPADPAIAHSHTASGSAWQPLSVPMHVWSRQLGSWTLMAHGALFLAYNQQGGPRGVGKFEAPNWLMLMEQHSLGGGSIQFREMLSAEPLTTPHGGFPQLFQTGETYKGVPLVDRQHPHDVFGELAVLITLPVTERVRWEFYGGPAGEPAFGPVTYLHRVSASELEAAPLGHHLQDSTHTSFGVVTSGFIIDRLKIEGSVFNGHEPNEQRWSIQLGTLDSWSVRGTVAPVRNWVAQYSYGLLVHPEALEPGSQRRQSASIEYNRLLPNGYWATSVIWGRVQKDFEAFPLNSYLLESTVNFFQRNYAYTRMELVDKDELFGDGPGHPSYRIGAYTFGGVRDLLHNHDWQLGLGADATFYSKPAVLNPVYGNDPVSFHVFLRIRPGLPEHQH